jgi:Sulfotransferase domain
MSLKVIGAGFGRTGTMSLKLALEQLGFGPCYHMAEVMTRPGHDTMWLALARGETSDWRAILDGFNATVDWPSTYFWRRLAADNPDAKIVLTLRDAEAWYRSAAATIFGRMLEFEALRAEALRAGELGGGELRGGSGLEALDPGRRRHMEMVNTIIVQDTFGGSLDKENAIRVFAAHNDAVRREVPPARLLVYEAGQGWEPLCHFLGVAVPDAPYPRVNSTSDFAAQFPKRR